jgi:hypothetical protein
MGANLGISQTKHTPLPLLATAISEGIFRIFSTECALPAAMLEMHGIMVTLFADSFWRKWPSLIKEGDIKICLHSKTMGEMGNNLKKVPAKIAVLISQWMLPPSGCVIMTLNVGTGKSPVHRGSIQLIFPPFHSSFERVQTGEPTVTLPKREVIAP